MVEALLHFRQTTKESLIHFMKNINTICTKNFHRVVKQLSEYEDILDKYSIQSSLMDDAGENSKKKYKSKLIKILQKLLCSSDNELKWKAFDLMKLYSIRYSMLIDSLS